MLLLSSVPIEPSKPKFSAKLEKMSSLDSSDDSSDSDDDFCDLSIDEPTVKKVYRTKTGGFLIEYNPAIEW